MNGCMYDYCVYDVVLVKHICLEDTGLEDNKDFLANCTKVSKGIADEL